MSGDEEGALVPQPVDVNEKDNFGCTALHVAIHARCVHTHTQEHVHASLVLSRESTPTPTPTLCVPFLPSHAQTGPISQTKPTQTDWHFSISFPTRSHLSHANIK
jgi:hypothetical protein